MTVYGMTASEFRLGLSLPRRRDCLSGLRRPPPPPTPDSGPRTSDSAPPAPTLKRLGLAHKKVLPALSPRTLCPSPGSKARSRHQHARRPRASRPIRPRPRCRHGNLVRQQHPRLAHQPLPQDQRSEISQRLRYGRAGPKGPKRLPLQLRCAKRPLPQPQCPCADPAPAQRAHANFTEHHASLLAGLFIVGLRFPFPAAALGASWGLSRLTYLFGYTSAAGPPGRSTVVGPSLRLTRSLSPAPSR